jgi:hypothetical protein
MPSIRQFILTSKFGRKKWKHFCYQTDYKATIRQQTMIRKTLSIIAGYAIFAATSLAPFPLSGHDPHADPTTIFIILTTIYGAIFSFIAGQILAIFIFAPVSILGGIFYDKLHNK